jgi:hypothetical protein
VPIAVIDRPISGMLVAPAAAPVVVTHCVFAPDVIFTPPGRIAAGSALTASAVNPAPDVSAAVVVVVVGAPAATTVQSFPMSAVVNAAAVDESWFDPDVIAASVTVLPSAFQPLWASFFARTPSIMRSMRD